MKIVKAIQCAWIIQPGEFTIDTWDGQRCSETKPHLLAYCHECDKSYCLMMHWQKHYDADHRSA